ncbi:hypothetical protein DEU56DRAFT_826657 [Suillus clintonianus]|uniref:uncharacterized protein n=1 Tax=Suillus clintonianus TaxID=1904413 RepID=UPI001B88407A|nr:uncharacterized protein DEU56DRAFT_826657 [Suillus clintonianus]KAG2124817.1 hypothetical protein DEU56DRAFT_826657 [Suillus clintonianus]
MSVNRHSPMPGFTPLGLGTPTSFSSSESPQSVSDSTLSLPDVIQLPIPGVADLIPKTNRTSHAKRQPAGHIPRPRNAFILFRCDFVQQKKIPGHVESDHRNLSRIAGKIWRGMKKEQQKPWIDLALKEKERHAKMYPGYKYMPAQQTSKQKKVKSDRVAKEERELESRRAELSSVLVQRGHDVSSSSNQTAQTAPRFTPYAAPSRPRRSSSCPPVGAEPVYPSTDLESWAPFLVTHDDLARRPSRTTMYHSVTSEPIASPIPACDLPNLQPGGDPWFGAPIPYAWPLPDQEDDPLFETQLDSPFGQQDAELYSQHPEFIYSPFENLPQMSSMNMDRGGALGLDFTNPFDLDGFPFNADSFLPSSSDMSSILSPLGYPMSSNPSTMEGTR